jgi:hypothetical protein
MQSQESMYQPPEREPSRQSINTDPREQRQEGMPRREGYGEYGDGYVGPYAEPQMEGEKIRPTPQPPQRKKQRGWGLPILIIILIVLLGVGGSALASGRMMGGGMFASTSQIQPTKTFNVGTTPKVVVNNQNGDVRIHTGSAGKVEVNAQQSEFGPFSNSNDVKVRYEQNGDTINIVVEGNSGFLFFGNEVDFDITLPETSNVEVNSGSGDIELNQVQGSAFLQSGSGTIKASGISGQATFKTGSGDIEVTNITGQADLHTGSGDIELKQASLKGDSVLETGSGSISYEGSLDNQGSYKLRTGSGNVEMRLPENSSFSLNTSTGSGEVDNEFGSENVGNNPQAKLDINTGSGDITLRKE